MIDKTLRHSFGRRVALRDGPVGRVMIVLLFMAAGLAPAPGQSVNIDFEGGSGTPSKTYAGAGLPGVWNALKAPPSVPEPLVGLNGAPIAATITQLYASGVVFINDPGTFGDDEALLDDFVPGLGCVARGLRFDGLQNGTYDVITYAWAPASPTSGSLVFLEGNQGGGQVIGGPWPGALTLGVTHALHRAVITEGTLTTVVVAGFFWSDSYINGVQLRLVWLLGDLNCDGKVDFDDIDPFVLALSGRAAYYAQYPDCNWLNADCNGDGLVDFDDIDPFVGLLGG